MVAGCTDGHGGVHMHMELATSFEQALKRAYAIEGENAKITVIPDGLSVIVE